MASRAEEMPYPPTEHLPDMCKGLGSIPLLKKIQTKEWSTQNGEEIGSDRRKNAQEKLEEEVTGA